MLGKVFKHEMKSTSRLFLPLMIDLLLTHHPLIFKPLKKVNDDDFIALRVMSLIQYNVN